MPRDHVVAKHEQIRGADARVGLQTDAQPTQHVLEAAHGLMRLVVVVVVVVIMMMTNRRMMTKIDKIHMVDREIAKIRDVRLSNTLFPTFLS